MDPELSKFKDELLKIHLPNEDPAAGTNNDALAAKVGEFTQKFVDQHEADSRERAAEKRAEKNKNPSDIDKETASFYHKLTGTIDDSGLTSVLKEMFV